MFAVHLVSASNAPMCRCPLSWWLEWFAGPRGAWAALRKRHSAHVCLRLRPTHVSDPPGGLLSDKRFTALQSSVHADCVTAFCMWQCTIYVTTAVEACISSHVSLSACMTRSYYRGRGAFESMGAGIAMAPGDIAFKSNFATLDAASGVVLSRRADRNFEHLGPTLCAALNGALPKGTTTTIT